MTAASGASPLSRHSHGSLLSVVVIPRAGQTSIARLADGTIQIRVVAPPVDGAANAALLRFLAHILDVPRSRIEIVSGASSRRKRISIASLAPDELEARIHAAFDMRT